MRLLIELNGQPGTSHGRRIDFVDVVLLLVALPALVLGCALIFGAVYQPDPPSGVSVDDDNIIRERLSEITSSPTVGTRLRNALLALEAQASSSTDPPLVVTGLMIGPGGILLTTQSHGIHIYDRQTKTWHMSGDDDTNSDATADSSPGDTNAAPADVSTSSLVVVFPDQGDVLAGQGRELLRNSGSAAVVRLQPPSTGAVRSNDMTSGRGGARRPEGNQCLGI